jgi:hypothetical protein
MPGFRASCLVGRLARAFTKTCFSHFFQNKYEHRSALRGTPRFGFAGVPNALNVELNLLTLLEVALVPTS